MALEYFYHFFKASGFRDFLTRWQRKLSPKHTIFLQVRDWWKQRIRGSQRSGEWEDGPEQTEPVRQDGLAEKESKWDGRRRGDVRMTVKKAEGQEGVMGSTRSSWHTADGSSITVSPPFGGRSEELPPSAPPLLSPCLFLALPGCYIIKLGEERGEGRGATLRFTYLFNGNEVAVLCVALTCFSHFNRNQLHFIVGWTFV